MEIKFGQILEKIILSILKNNNTNYLAVPILAIMLLLLTRNKSNIIKI